jgi:hypothetical protein
MQVSHEKKFIFLKTVKTASTSIEQTLQKYCSDKEYIFGSELGGLDELNEDFSHKESPLGIITVPLFFSNLQGEVVRSYYWDHMTAEELKHKIGSNIWDNYFKFCVVRNPFEKVISIFSFITRGNQVGENVPKKLLFEMFLPLILETPLFCDKNIYTINGDICVDKILRYETLEKDFSSICDELGVSRETLPKINNQYRDKRLNCGEFYSDYSKELVSDRYAFEIGKFAYTFPN